MIVIIIILLDIYCKFFSNQEILSAIEKNMKKCIIEYYNYFVKVYTSNNINSILVIIFQNQIHYHMTFENVTK